MTSQVVSLWQKVLKNLSDMASGNYGSMVGVSDLLEQLVMKPEQPKSTWKTIIQDMKLPRQLGELACSQFMEDPYRCGPTVLPAAFTSTVGVLLQLANHDGICSNSVQGESEGLRDILYQQMADSGLIRWLEQLLEVTAQQLEQCTAAAAAAGDDGGGGVDGVAAAIAVAAANCPIPAHVPTIQAAALKAGCLESLQSIAGKLLGVQVRLHSLLDPNQFSKLASSTAAATHLMVAGMRHITTMLSQHQQGWQHQTQQQQQKPPKGLTTLAYYIAAGTVVAGNVSSILGKDMGIVLGRGPHFVVWSDITLLLTAYACIFKQQGQLPSVEGQPAKRGASKSSGRRQQQRRGPQQATAGREDLKQGLAAWQEVQDQCERVPATHKQLLELLGVSTLAALWVAAIMPNRGFELPYYWECLEWNPHHLAAAVQMVDGVTTPAAAPLLAAIDELQPQLQQWADTPLSELLLPLVLYGAAHAASGTEDFIRSCKLAHDTFTLLMSQRYLREAGLQAVSATPTEKFRALREAVRLPALSPIVRDEMLLLALSLLQQLQQQRKPNAAVATTGPVMFTSPAVREEYEAEAEAKFVQLLLLLASELQPEKSTQGLSPATNAVIMAAMVAGAAQGASRLFSFLTTGQWPGAAHAAAAGEQVTPGASASTGAAAQAAAAEAGSSSDIPSVFAEQAGAIFTALEGYARAQGSLAEPAVKTVTEIAALCCIDKENRPAQLLRLAQRGSSKQQAAFFNLLVTLLKVCATPPFNTDTNAGDQCSIWVASGAFYMFEFLCSSTAAASGTSNTVSGSSSNLLEGGSGSSNAVSSGSNSNSEADDNSDMSAPPALWLLLLGRCCLQWAAKLGQMQAEGANWVQVVMQAQQQQWLVDQHGNMPKITTVSFCLAGSYPLLLNFADTVTDLLGDAAISISTGPAAAVYDLGPVEQALKALAACYPEVVQTDVSEAVAGNVAGLIGALESVGKAVSVFAVPHCCNNPGCSNMAGVTEKGIVSGKGCICGRCKIARYCAKSCQQQHWKQHKRVCKKLGAVQ